MTAPIHANAVAGSPSHGPAQTSAARGFAEALERELARIDASPSRAVADAVRASDPRRILEIQSAIYRHAERVELVSRLADHAVGAVKTLLQTRV